MDKEQEKQWQQCADLWAIASKALEEIEVILLIQLKQTGKPAKVVSAAIDAVSGQAYMFTPQSTWIGAESWTSNLPHIAR